MKRARAIAEARDRRISAANFLETATVIDRSRDPVASRRLDELLRQVGIIHGGGERTSGEKLRARRTAILAKAADARPS